ncbi:hypothetical protein MTR67_026679 [Solanum verrucosum]|uniref:DUF4283 domain-containing protein n=1 Tax=Solanum verrucosum TaxID=315347 RepID=A0AAF0TV14_SOLVR|nr:hypothetical protein MTR67_026679 [Solanum verrucosum]
MAMAWISFPNILPTFFVKECLFSIAAAVDKPIQLDQATIKKTRPSCARVKVLVDFKGKFPTSVQMNMKNSKIGEIRSMMVTIQQDYVPKYCFECKMQGHNKNNCKAGTNTRRKEKQATQVEQLQHVSQEHNPLLQKGKAKVLSSGKIVRDMSNRNVVKDRRGSPLKTITPN